MAQQTYANHRQFFPLFHFFALPIVVLNVLIVFGGLVRLPSLAEVWPLVVAIGVAAGFLACRASILTVHDRLIGLEMCLGLAAVLPPELGARIPELRIRHLVGLRFADDGELPHLVTRCMAGELREADQGSMRSGTGEATTCARERNSPTVAIDSVRVPDAPPRPPRT